MEQVPRPGGFDRMQHRFEECEYVARLQRDGCLAGLVEHVNVFGAAPDRFHDADGVWRLAEVACGEAERDGKSGGEVHREGRANSLGKLAARGRLEQFTEDGTRVR